MTATAELSRTQRYMARVEQALRRDMFCDADRRDFLTEQIENWEQLFRDFQRRVDAGFDPGDVRAEDYVETLAALGAALNRISEKEAA